MTKNLKALKPLGGGGNSRIKTKNPAYTSKIHELISHKHGFTLAEVLITLAIIGVVAALTIPTVVKNYRSKQLEAAFKKSYSEVSRAVSMYYVDSGAPYYPDFTVDQKHIDMLKKYFSVTEGNVPNYFVRGNLYKVYPKRDASPYYAICYNGDGFSTKGGLTIYMGDNWGGGPATYPNNARLIYICIDTNGYKKGPNRWGFDLFTFAISPSKNVLSPPTGPYRSDTWFEVGSTGDSRTMCSTNDEIIPYNGISCGYWALLNVNRDDNSKTYWDNLPW